MDFDFLSNGISMAAKAVNQFVDSDGKKVADANLSFLSIDVGTIIFTLLNLLILFWVFKHFLFKRVHKILDERKNSVDEKFQEADDAMEHAKGLETKYTELMDNAKEQSAEMVKDATKRAQQRSDEIIANAKSEAAAIKQRADEDVEKEKKRAEQELRGEISELAVLVAQKVVEKEINEADHEKYINEFIENVGDLK